MTAEIAIINRAAVTLAADSAMTLHVRGQQKIYTATDKLFELSSCQPIGIMVYNNLEFMGVPFELAIKQFRELNRSKEFSTVEAASVAFLEHLVTGWKPDAELLKKHGFEIVYPIFRQLRVEFNDELRLAFSSAPTSRRKRSRNFPDIATLFLNIVARYKDGYESAVSDGELGSIPIDRLAETYQDVVDEAISGVFDGLPLDDEDRTQLHLLALHVLRSKRFSGLLTGLVFAGFGSDEMFPALHAVEIDGVVGGVLKKRNKKNFVSKRNELEAEIIPFAQREMADRFMFGVDPEFEAGIEGFLEDLLRKTGALIIKHSKVARKKERVLTSKLEEAVTESLKSLRDELLPRAKKKFREQVEDMVLFMPKAELASFAEALVNITSIKRKYSAEQETVAGPVDVAVISKNDGFVWVKRKHYFQAELNPRFFWRKYGQ